MNHVDKVDFLFLHPKAKKKVDILNHSNFSLMNLLESKIFLHFILELFIIWRK